MLCYDLLCEILTEFDSHSQYLVECTVPEAEGNAPIHSQVLDLLHVAHLNDQVIDGSEGQQSVMVTHFLHLHELLHRALKLWMVKPGHLDYLGQGNNHHLYHLSVTRLAMIGQIVQKVIPDPNLLLSWDLVPILDKEHLES